MELDRYFFKCFILTSDHLSYFSIVVTGKFLFPDNDAKIILCFFAGLNFCVSFAFLGYLKNHVKEFTYEFSFIVRKPP